MTIASPWAAVTTGTSTETGTGPAATASTGACAGCGKALAPTAEWCWLCHRAVEEPAQLTSVGPTTGDDAVGNSSSPAAADPAAVGTSAPAGAAAPAVRGWWRLDLRPRTAIPLAAAIVVVLVPLLSLLLSLGSADDPGSGGTDGLLGSGDRVDVRELGRPAGP